MKIKFNSDNDLPLNKPLKFHLMTVIIRSVLEGGKLYLQVFLDDALHEDVKMKFNPNQMPVDVIKEGRLEEHILETFILVLLESGTKNHGKNSIS